jgi:Glycosyltransferase family 87
MKRARDILRSGDWLTRERIRLVAVALVFASTIGFLYLIVTAHGVIDRQGRPLGTDFSNVYAAGTYVLDGDPEAAFDPARQYARERAIFGAATPFYGWHYPPYFLFVAGALAKMPYGLALAFWQAITLGLYLLTIRVILISSLPSPERGGSDRRASRMFATCALETSELGQARVRWRSGEGAASAKQKTPLTPTRQPSAADLPLSGGGKSISDPLWLLLALAFPAVLVNIGHGQNGFLTAALLGGALVALDRRPLLAGILFGLLVYKPQFGLMIPIALAAGARWRSFLAAAATVAILTLVTAVAFGPQIWQAFLVSTHFARTVALEQGGTGWHKIQSAFSWARMWGAPIPLAYALQGALIVALGAALVWLWRSAAPYALKAAALCLATILATPYTFDYDMMVLAPAIAFLAANGLARGFSPGEKTALAALWLVPLIARSVAQASLIPLGVPAMLAMFILVLRRAELDRTLPMAFAGGSSTITRDPSGTSRGHDIAAFE